MKLRIQGDSLRLRISPSETSRLVRDGRLAETIHLGADAQAAFTYALEHNAGETSIRLRYEKGEISVIAPTAEVRRWAGSEDVGLYADIDTGAGIVELSIEKDFACLDRTDEQNADTYPNPHRGTVC